MCSCITVISFACYTLLCSSFPSTHFLKEHCYFVVELSAQACPLSDEFAHHKFSHPLFAQSCLESHGGSGSSGETFWRIPFAVINLCSEITEQKNYSISITLSCKQFFLAHYELLSVGSLLLCFSPFQPFFKKVFYVSLIPHLMMSSTLEQNSVKKNSTPGPS